MTVKHTITFLLLIMCSRVHSQDNSVSIFGKWQHVSEYSHDGACGYEQKIKHGEVLIFEKENIVKDSLGNVGTYYLKKNILSIKLNGTERAYNVHFSNNIMSLSPTHHVCDEGCHSTYSKLLN